MIHMAELKEKYLRKDMMPTIMCAGCGNGVVLNQTLHAIDAMQLDIDSTVFVSGIGCSSRLNIYVDADTIHTTHGRAIAYATGIKAANPDLNVIVFTGDGDCAGIGGNHLIHAIRRNIDITVIAINNYTYGMTGGQISPTTPTNSKTTTTPYGSFEHPLDISKLAVAAGAPYVARWTIAHPKQLQLAIKKGIEKKGFSFIEALSPCPTSYWRRNRQRDLDKIYAFYKENTVPIKTADKYPDKIEIGLFQNIDKPEWTDEWKQLVGRVSK